jgi:hypothetical protein
MPVVLSLCLGFCQSIYAAEDVERSLSRNIQIAAHRGGYESAQSGQYDAATIGGSHVHNAKRGFPD